jgi:O-antigen ligase
VRAIALAVVLTAIPLALGVLVAQSQPSAMLLGMCALVIVTVTFVKAEWGLYILIFSMLLSPEITAGVTGRATLDRGVTLRLEDVLLVLIGLGWFARGAVMKDLGLFLKTPLNKPILFYTLACVLSTGFGFIAGRVDLKTGALYVLKYCEYFIVFFMTVNHVRDLKQAKRFLTCLFLTALVVAIIGIIQIPSGARVSAPFEGHGGEPNTLGGYLLLIGMVAAGIVTKVKDSRFRKPLLFLICLIAPPFFFTQSRSSYLGLIIAVISLSLMVERRGIILGLVAVGLLISPLFLPSIVTQRVMFTFSQPEEPGQFTIGELRLDTSTSARLQSWSDVIRDFQQHPVLGYGVTGYAFVDVQVPRILAETGLLGLTTFIYLLYSIFKQALHRLRGLEDPFIKGLATGFLAGFIGLIGHSFGANTFILVRIMEPFWFLLGIIVALPTGNVKSALPQACANPRGGKRYAPGATRHVPSPSRLP